MKGFTFGFLVAFTALPVMAATVPSRLIPTSNTETANSSTVNSRMAPANNNTSDTTAARKSSTEKQTTSRVATVTRAMPTRIISAPKTSARTTSSDASRVTDRGVVAARLQSNDTVRSNLSEAVNTVGRSSRTSAASINNNPAVRRMGLSLRPSTAEVGGRALIGDTGKQTGSNIENDIRNVSSRAAVKLDAAAISEAKEQMEQTSELNKSCQEMYNECMDQFCAVVDTNQKRCSCSADLARYNKVEAAVKDANIQLNEVAQNIRYIGLSPDEVRAIMTETEAEEALSGTKDTTESRKMLERIENMIMDPKTTGSSDSSDSLGLLDIDIDFSSDNLSDMFSLGSLFGDGNRGISSMRGKELYNAAKKRCDTVLKQCKDAGATTQQVTGNYDLGIDKDCAAYEAGLNKMNETLLANVRSANRMLQKARLTVMQDQNTYDARACIGAMETCMTDDVVCGSDYVKCLDPTKTFIDENGSVVLGANIAKIRQFMTNYNNAAITKSSLADAYKIVITTPTCSGEKNDGSCIVKYLIDKIGTKQKATEEGLCRPVLDKCRAYTYDTNGTYIPYNDVVVSYVQRAMVNIKSAQSKIISDYASTCLTDISNCYNNQVSQLNSWTTAASANNIRSVMRGACRNVALTCAYAIFDNDTTSCPDGNENTCIDNISNVFYQSLLCPDNSIYDWTAESSPHTISPNGTKSTSEEPAWVNGVCKCSIGYMTSSGTCTLWCPSNSTLDTTAISRDENCATMGVPTVGCRCNSGYVSYNGGCSKINNLQSVACTSVHNSTTYTEYEESVLHILNQSR